MFQQAKNDIEGLLNTITQEMRKIDEESGVIKPRPKREMPIPPSFKPRLASSVLSINKQGARLKMMKSAVSGAVGSNY